MVCRVRLGFGLWFFCSSPDKVSWNRRFVGTGKFRLSSEVRHLLFVSFTAFASSGFAGEEGPAKFSPSQVLP
jgi:hypothetical protein